MKTARARAGSVALVIGLQRGGVHLLARLPRDPDDVALAALLTRRRTGAGGDLRDVGDRCTATYGLNGGGAVLVCPGGFVARRSRNAVADPKQAFAEARVRLHSRL